MHTPVGQTPLILASASPRRRELLGHLGSSFEIAAADLDETPRPGEEPRPYVTRLAREKALKVAARHPGAWVLAADTTVALGTQILGKPGDEAEVREMLGRLSGKTHEVHTGVTLAGPGGAEHSTLVSTRVTFRALSAEEIAWHAAMGGSLDKAGGYAMQGRGGALVASVEGSPTNVIGLPLGETLELLVRAGVALPWRAP